MTTNKNIYYKVKNKKIHKKYNIRSFSEWRKLLANDKDWDYSFFWSIVAHKLYNMEKNNIKSDINFNKGLKEARILAERLGKDNYHFKMHLRGYEIPKINLIAQEKQSEKRDIEYFCKILEKYSLGWWW